MSLITAEQLNKQLDPTLWPMLSSVEWMEDTVRLSLYVPDDLSYFAGHFPGQPVLPGVVQVHWAGELAKTLFAAKGFSELKSVKFNSMILPNQTVSLTLSFNADKGSLRFDYVSGEEKFSSGSLVFSGGDI